MHYKDFLMINGYKLIMNENCLMNMNFNQHCIALQAVPSLKFESDYIGVTIILLYL